jgi:hypothetical protein
MYFSWPLFESGLSISTVYFLFYTWQETSVSYLRIAYDSLTSKITSHQALLSSFVIIYGNDQQDATL